MMRGDGDVVAGWKNKIQTTIANVTPAGALAEMHRRMAEPGSGNPEDARKQAEKQAEKKRAS